MTEPYEPPTLPPFIPVHVIAKACDMSRQRTLRMLRNRGIAKKLKGRWEVGQQMLREEQGEIFDLVYTWYCKQAG